jgi:hypothetical protein
MTAAIWLLNRLGTPTWLAALAWIVPTSGALVWTVLRPTAAVVTDDDDDSWAGYAIRYVMVGENAPRGTPVRVLAALAFGAPVIWALLVFGVSTLVGLF